MDPETTANLPGAETFTTDEPEPESRYSSHVESQAAAQLRQIFDDYEDGSDRVKHIVDEFFTSLDMPPDVIARIEQDLEQTIGQDRAGFMASARQALEPAFRWRQEHLAEIMPPLREKFFEKLQCTRLNEILGYGGEGEHVHVHIAPAEDIPDQVMPLVLDGFQHLADAFRRDTSLKRVTVTSWIVAEHPKIMERLGFTIEGPISAETREQYFSTDPRPISRATMSREQLLEKFKAV